MTYVLYHHETLTMIRSRAVASLRIGSSSLLRQDAVVLKRTIAYTAVKSKQDPASLKTTEKGHASQLSPATPEVKQHGKATVAIVKLVGRLLGYNSLSSKAIRVTSELYDRCAERADLEADFWYGECGLPRTYQSWFQITNMHVHLLLTRFRALPAKEAQAYSQELINHYFIDSESRMRVRFGVQTNRLVTGYMREMHAQQRGSVLGLDEAMSYSISRETDRERFGEADAALATALWRNLWGAGGWGRGVGGVKRKLRGIDKLSDEEKAARKKAGKAAEVEEAELEGMPELAEDTASLPLHQNLPSLDSESPINQLKFANSLQKLVRWYRRETARLGEVSNQDIEKGRTGVASALGYGRNEAERKARLEAGDSVANFSRI